MTPYEIMLSESQERMLLVAERGREREVFDVFHKWGLDAVEVGRVTDDGKLRVLNHGQRRRGNSRARAGRRRAALRAPDRRACGSPLRTDGRLVKFAPDGADLTENFRRLLASPDIASKEWITEQYDSMVRTNTRVGPGAGDAAVLRLKERSARSRSRPTATAAGDFFRRASARCTPWRRRRATLPARARFPSPPRIA